MEKIIEIGSDFSGVGSLIQALIRLGIKHKEIFACDQDKYARETYIENYGDPGYFPDDVYKRKIPKRPLDIYVSTPSCQSFSLAGKRLGEEDDRGILFYNSHEFIKINKPRYFIFENVKGLLSDDKKNQKDKIGRTFRRWLDYLGGKSVNGNPILFPHEKSVPYHVYYKVMNAKEYGVPQNRERVFIIGIRDDCDNNFKFPRSIPLEKKLIDVIEDNVDLRYFLSQKMIDGLNVKNHQDNGFKFSPKGSQDYVANCVTARCFKMGADDNYIMIGKETRTEESKAERRRTGTNSFRGKQLEFRESDVMNCIATSQTNDNLIKIGSWKSDGKDFDSYVRRLTPRECFRLMDFPDDFVWNCSDTQAYKQAGNSIVVRHFIDIINNLKL